MLRRRALLGVGLCPLVIAADAGEPSWTDRDGLVLASYLNEGVASLNKGTASVKKLRPLIIHPRSLLPNAEELGWSQPAHVQAVLRGVSESAAKDLLLQGRATRLIRFPLAHLDVRLTAVCATEAQLDGIFKEDGLDAAWRRFYKMFPGSAGLLQFSSVGYSTDHKQAVFVDSMACGGLCGSGRLVAMSKQDGRWGVQNWKSLWVS